MKTLYRLKNNFLKYSRSGLLAIVFAIIYYFIEDYKTSFTLLGIPQNYFIATAIGWVALVLLLICGLYPAIRNTKSLIKKGNLFLPALIFLLVCIFILSTSLALLIILFLAIALIGQNYKKIAGTFFWTSVVMMVITLMLRIAGVLIYEISDCGFFCFYGPANNVFAFGFSNPNTAGRFFIPILFCGTYLYRDKVWRSSLIFCIAIILSLITQNITFLLLTIFYGAIFYSIKYKITQKMSMVVVKYGLIMITAITILVATLFGTRNALPNIVNDVLAYRPYLWNLRIESGNIYCLTGRCSSFDTAPDGRRAVIDNMPLSSIIRHGIPVFLLMVLLYYIAPKFISGDKYIMVMVAGIMPYYFAEGNISVVAGGLLMLFVLISILDPFIIRRRRHA